MQNTNLIGLLISWIPGIVLIAVWIFIMYGLRKRGGFGAREQLEEMRRHNQILERIAIALEKKN